ncbi:MAG: carboxylating nicotinate-nucleotide diphosphorylase [Gemmatimonadota bacterium]
MSGPFGEMQSISAFVRAALAEDVGTGDVTTAATITPGAHGRARIGARASGVVAGLAAAGETYREVDPAVRFEARVTEGEPVETGVEIARAEGSFASLLVAERTTLNFLRRLSGVATLTARFVAAISVTKATIVDTRKTTPGLRALEKAAVVAGGGANHRMGLRDAYLIKENHVAAAGGITQALRAVAARNPLHLPVEIEVRSLGELDEALECSDPPDRILLDNLAVPELAHAVERVRAGASGILLEASGGISLETVRAVAETGVDWISGGALTHSAPALDLSCLIEPT